MADIISLQELADAKLDAQSLERFINGGVDEEVLTRLSQQYPTIKKLLLEFQKYNGRAYKTYAEMDADKANLSPKTKVTVTNDATASNNGDWQWDGVAFTKSAYDPLTQAKSYTNSNIRTVKSELAGLASAPDQSMLAVLVDADDKVLVGFDTQNDKPVIAGIENKIKDIAFKDLSGLRMSSDADKIAVLVDSNNKILIGFDPLLDKPILSGLEVGSAQSIRKQAFSQKLLSKEVNHLLFYGQSLSVGAVAPTILSSVQMYLNKTFDTGTRMFGSEATATKPLVEDNLSPAPDGGSNRGETPCSGAANYASRAMLQENGIDPASHVIFASTAGRGGTPIRNLKKGSTWYNSTFLNHVNKALALNGADYKVQVVPWIQGETDADQGITYSDYLSQLLQLPIDISADVRTITGQTDDVPLITYQCSYKAATHKDIALAQLQAAKQSDRIFFAAPTYRFPYASDQTHLTNVGYKLMGAYFGRAYKQLVIDNVEPDFLNPLSAKAEENKITIKFDVPKLPLQLDTVNLALTADMGFKVLDSSNNTISITGISADKDTVILTLANTIAADVKVRYGFDYLGSSLNIMNGASGNLRDSADEKVTISGNEYQLFNACPAFEITAFLDKGI